MPIELSPPWLLKCPVHPPTEPAFRRSSVVAGSLRSTFPSLRATMTLAGNASTSTFRPTASAVAGLTPAPTPPNFCPSIASCSRSVSPQKVSSPNVSNRKVRLPSSAICLALSRITASNPEGSCALRVRQSKRPPSRKLVPLNSLMANSSHPCDRVAISVRLRTLACSCYHFEGDRSVTLVTFPEAVTSITRPQSSRHERSISTNRTQPKLAPNTCSRGGQRTNSCCPTSRQVLKQLVCHERAFAPVRRRK